MIVATRRAFGLALLVLWPLIPCAAAERGTRVFVVEEGVFSVAELKQVFTAFPERENTLYFGTYEGLRLSEQANAAETLAASDGPAADNLRPNSEKLGHVAARAISAAAQYYRLNEPGTNSSSEEKSELGRVEFVVLLAHFNTAEQPVAEAETDACAWKESQSARREMATHRDLPLVIDAFRLHIETNAQKTVPRVLARAVAISLGALNDIAGRSIELIETGCPEESARIDLDPVDLSVPCPSSTERTTNIPASPTLSEPLARPVCNTPIGLAVGQQPPPNPPSPATPLLPSPPVTPTPVAAPPRTTTPAGAPPPAPASNPPNQVAALPPPPAPSPPPQPALPPAQATLPAPEAGFAFQMAAAAASTRTLADVAVVSQSSNSQATLWLAPLDLGGVPDPAAMTSGTARWTVTPGDRYEPGRTQRVFLLLSPAGACQAGETLWAKVSLDGAWLAPGEAGQRTLGGKIVDCDKPGIAQEILSLTQKELQ